MATFFSHVYNQILATNIWSASKPFLCIGRPMKVSDKRKRLSIAAAPVNEKMENDERNQFWRSAKCDVDYWQTYLDARPKYDTGDFYQRLLSYHQSHQPADGAWPTIAHDVGTGPGQVAAILAKHFDQVVASDLNNTHLEAAYRMLNLADGKHNITLTSAGGENLIKYYPDSSASMITAAECMPLMNIPVAVDSWSQLLKPSGTLAMWFYGRPSFEPSNDYDAAACNAIYEQIATLAFRPFYNVEGPRLVNVRKATDTMVNWLDNVDLDPSIWSDVQRWKWNSDLPMEFSHAQDLGWSLNKINKIHDGEKVECIDDRHLWSEMWTVEEWNKFLKVNLPAFSGEWDEQIQDLWTQLEEKMGGKTVQRRTIWPVVCIVATRREGGAPATSDDESSGSASPRTPMKQS